MVSLIISAYNGCLVRLWMFDLFNSVFRYFKFYLVLQTKVFFKRERKKPYYSTMIWKKSSSGIWSSIGKRKKSPVVKSILCQEKDVKIIHYRCRKSFLEICNIFLLAKQFCSFPFDEKKEWSKLLVYIKQLSHLSYTGCIHTYQVSNVHFYLAANSIISLLI